MGNEDDLSTEEWAAIEADGLQSGVDTPGCDCTHEGMGRGWHLQGCAWLSAASS
jgi:hypothetical protein